MPSSAELVVELQDQPNRSARAWGWLLHFVLLAGLGFMLLEGWGAAMGALIAAVMVFRVERGIVEQPPANTLRLGAGELVLPMGYFVRRPVRVPIADVTRVELDEGRLTIEAGAHAGSFDVSALVGGDAAARTLVDRLVDRLVAEVSAVSEQHAQRLRDRAALAAQLRARRSWFTVLVAIGILVASNAQEVHNGVLVAAFLAITGQTLQCALGTPRFAVAIALPAVVATLVTVAVGVAPGLSIAVATVSMALAILLVLTQLRLRAAWPLEVRIEDGFVVAAVLVALEQAATIGRSHGLYGLVGVPLGLGCALWAVLGPGGPARVETAAAPPLTR